MWLSLALVSAILGLAILVCWLCVQLYRCRRQGRSLQERVTEQQALWERAPQALLVVDAAHRLILQATPHTEKLLAKPVSQIVGLPLATVLPLDQAVRYEPIFHHPIDAGAITTLCMLDDGKISVEMHAVTVALRV